MEAHAESRLGLLRPDRSHEAAKISTRNRSAATPAEPRSSAAAPPRCTPHSPPIAATRTSRRNHFRLPISAIYPSPWSHCTHETFGMLRQRAPDLPAHSRAVANAALASENRLRERFRSLARPQAHRPAHPHSRRPSSRPGSFHRRRFRLHRFRRRARAHARRAPRKAFATSRPGRHGSLVPLRRLRRALPAARRCRSAIGRMALARPICQRLVSRSRRRVSARLFRRQPRPRISSRPTATESDFWLHFWLLGKAVYELKYELNHRLDWVAIPLEGIATLIGGAAAS